MPDVVVTVPKDFRFDGSGRKGLGAWVDEGDAAGTPWSGRYWCYRIWMRPDIVPGERVYVVCNGVIRGYAPLVQLRDYGNGGFGLIRGGGAVAVTVPKAVVGFVQGFRGFRYRWWEYTDEVPFPDWEKQ